MQLYGIGADGANGDGCFCKWIKVFIFMDALKYFCDDGMQLC